MPSRLILLLALLFTAAVYWTGLSGPFIFDDTWNLEPIRLWHAGQASLREVIFPQSSVVFSRPVSMASFALTTWLFGTETFSFKLGNLITHLVCGVIAWLVLRRVLTSDKRLAAHAELLAALAAAIWLLHPLQVSTVLYAVQRMAQLSTLFTLAAIWVYLVARQQLSEGRIGSAKLNLFLAFPVLVLLGVLSKQNAVIAPALCLVLEIAYFGRQVRPGRSVRMFFSVFLLLPLLGAATALLIAPHRLLAGYAEWDFTLWQRLLTQPRVLVDYIGMLLLPRGPLMGLYTDDFVVSQGLLSPPSTLLALFVLLAVSAVSVALRKRAPTFFMGWWFFLVAHAVESSFLPLEMYYEHRNYLPSIGMFVAIIGLMPLLPAIKTHALSPRKLGLLAAAGFILASSIATLGRVFVWKDMETIAKLGVQTHPDSSRARFDVAAWALQRGDFETALASMRYLATSTNSRHRQLGNLSIVTINCMRGTEQQSLTHLQRAASENLPKLTTVDAQAFVRISGATRANGCGQLPRKVIASYLQDILDDAAAQPESASPKQFSRYALADLYARDGQWGTAQEQAKLAWNGGRDEKIGIFLAGAYIRNGQLQAASQMLAELRKTIKPYASRSQTSLTALERALVRSQVEAATPSLPTSSHD